jgi:hypothetical protein
MGYYRREWKAETRPVGSVPCDDKIVWSKGTLATAWVSPLSENPHELEDQKLIFVYSRYSLAKYLWISRRLCVSAVNIRLESEVEINETGSPNRLAVDHHRTKLPAADSILGGSLQQCMAVCFFDLGHVTILVDDDVNPDNS